MQFPFPFLVHWKEILRGRGWARDTRSRGVCQGREDLTDGKRWDGAMHERGSMNLRETHIVPVPNKLAFGLGLWDCGIGRVGFACMQETSHACISSLAGMDERIHQQPRAKHQHFSTPHGTGWTRRRSALSLAVPIPYPLGVQRAEKSASAAFYLSLRGEWWGGMGLSAGVRRCGELLVMGSWR